MRDNQPSGMGDIHINFVRYMTADSSDMTDQNLGRSAAPSDRNERHRWSERKQRLINICSLRQWLGCHKASIHRACVCTEGRHFQYFM